jgi:MFS family permease
MYHNILLKKQGGCGKFQWLLFITVICGLSGFGYVEYGLGFYELFPQFDCVVDGLWVEKCTTAQICQGSSTNQTEYVVNYNNHTSLYNWVEQLDLVCDKGSQIGLIGSLYFAGWSSTILFLPWLADKIGRRWIFFFSVLVTSFACLGLYLSQNLNFTISLMFIVGMANSGRVMVGFLYASEFMTPKW